MMLFQLKTSINMFSIQYCQYWCADVSQRVLLLTVERVEVLARLLIEQNAAFEPDDDLKKAVSLHTY